MDLNTPIWQLTVGQYIELQQSITPTIIEKHEELDNLAYGLDGLAQLIGCSKSQAFRIKESGRLDDAITQLGRKIIIDKRLALELLKEPKKRRR